MSELSIVIFGITSNLAQIKLIPSLYRLFQTGFLPESTTIIGVSRSKRDQGEFKKLITQSLALKQPKFSETDPSFTAFAKKLTYLAGDISQAEFYTALQAELKKTAPQQILCYFAISPELYEPVLHQLSSHGFSKNDSRIKLVLEKPLGIDLPSAQNLNKLLLQHFSEEQIYRVDHYLGKETVQNILSFRFGNGLFEPLITAEHIDHIQITSAENFGVNARSYYANVGALKDVGQNHLLQLLTFATMNAPSSYTNDSVTTERVRLLRQLDSSRTKLVLGQYEGYRYEPGVQPESQTDTFFAFKTYLTGERFADIPIYVRAGKALAQSVTEISIVFKVPHTRLFAHLNQGTQPNVLTYRIQPNEGTHVQLLVKKPGHELELELNQLQFCYESLGHDLLEPYEHILYDAIVGNQTFFNDAAEVEAQWRFIDAISQQKPAVELYPKGSWGPTAADQLLQKDGRAWIQPQTAFCQPLQKQPAVPKS